ncbi:hypothetical protein SHANETTE_46 [Bacillus phage Shanette]|uniref:Uncharacterized protein n=1 Tax=Bacillus phage Shanette TaxID=1296656 RepID=S5MT37_9CAUD|nr:hypothetical protein AVV46_gp046 [Bacillus phage Shanette]AGR46947.1 hypothetical protein SHANETTE_46 [Bacillus phage Shanette]
MKGKTAFWSGFLGAFFCVTVSLGTWSVLDSLYDKGYDKGVKVGIEQGKKDAMKDIELSYDMCVKKKGE